MFAMLAPTYGEGDPAQRWPVMLDLSRVAIAVMSVGRQATVAELEAALVVHAALQRGTFVLALDLEG